MTQVLTLEQQLEELKKQQAELRAKLKEQNKKEKRPIKGVPVEFTNKAGEVIKGYGVEYICVTINGRTHLKEKSNVKFLETLD